MPQDSHANPSGAAPSSRSQRMKSTLRSASSQFSIDEQEKLSCLQLLKGVSITTPTDEKSAKQELKDLTTPSTDEKLVKQELKDLTDYIVPCDLRTTVEGIPTERLEIAMLQLQQKSDHLDKATPLQNAGVLNNLGCVYALLGRYTKAEECLEQALLNKPLDETIKHNQCVMKKIKKDNDEQEYWGKIGDQQ
jgi:tetratricopeptide (TPR) repeat protein